MGRPAAFFDVDGVLLKGKGLVLFARYLVRTGRARVGYLLRGAAYAAGHRLGVLDGASVLRRIAARELAGKPRAELVDLAQQWFSTKGRRRLYAEGLVEVQRVRARGLAVYLVSGGMDFLVEPISRHVGAAGFVAVEPEVRDGCFTGRLSEPLCIDEGKLKRASRLAAARDVDIGRSIFYGDDYGDIPLLEAVGEPVVVNPDPRLRREASRRGWPVRRFRITGLAP